MGIKQLFKSLEIYIEDAHLSSFRGFRVGVDTNAWIHSGARQCAEELADKQKTNRYVTYVLSKVKMLQAYGLIPTMVFDGKPLLAKRETSRARGELRKKKLDEAKQYRSSGNSTKARRSFQKAVTVTPMMVYAIVKELQGLCINYVVAPHEADAQLAFLCKNGLVDAVISDDADMVPFGCHRIFRELDWRGNFRELNCENFSRFAEFSETKGTCDSIDLSGFDHQMIIIMCVMYGCDYLKGQFQLTIAHSLVKKYKGCYNDLIEASKKERCKLPEGYWEELKRAVNIFKHQVVYDTVKQCTVHLSKCTADGADLSYLGILLPSDMGKEIEVGPRAMLNYKDGFISKEVAPTSSSEREHKPLGKGLGSTLEFLRDRGPTGEERFLNESSSNRRNMDIKAAGNDSSFAESPAEYLNLIASKCGSKVEFKPAYSVESEFAFKVWFDGEFIGEGYGRTRKDAQNQAAERSLMKLSRYYLDRLKTEEGSSINQYEHEEMCPRKKPKTRLVLDPP